LDGSSDTVVVADRTPERPSWAPDGTRLAFYSATPRPGVYVSARNGWYINLVTAERSVPAWSHDGSRIFLADRPGEEPGYNGDPDRGVDRVATEWLGKWSGRLLAIAAPLPPAERPDTVAVTIALDRGERNAAAFDRFFARIDRVYYSTGQGLAVRSAWLAIRDRYRARALEARNDLELERVLHEMLRARPPLRAEAAGRAAISSAHPLATEAGLEILRRGGNVVDAAVAVSFALGVVEPDASGVGGYGEMLIFLAGMERPVLIEFMARVPEEATLSNANLMEGGRYPSDGPLLAMVPGTVAGMYSAWQRYGSRKLPWSDLLAPAIRAARAGYEVSDGLATTLRRERERFLKYPGSRALFFPAGEPLRAGDTLRNPDLAWTLEQVARGGADAFYRGPVGERIVQDLRGQGSALRPSDLARYFAVDREPVFTTYRNAIVYSSAPPASGGAVLAAQLNGLEQLPAPRLYTEDAATLHAMIAAWQLVPSGRGRIGDPGLWPVDIAPFVSKEAARGRWRCFDPARALTLELLRGEEPLCGSDQGSDRKPDQDAAATSAMFLDGLACNTTAMVEPLACRAAGTTAFAVADAEGNVVVVTQTLGTWGGNFYVTPGLGFLYNDKLTSYGTDPNGYGARLPYARHGSTLAPTILVREDPGRGRTIVAVAAAGNAWITSAVYQTLVGIADFGLGPQRALELPRFLVSQRSGGRAGQSERELVVGLEDGFAPEVVRRLLEMGYNLEFISAKGELRMGYGAALVVRGGAVSAGADPRRAGSAGSLR
jgi:gamma-glutamyltranspeptidase